MNVGSENGVTVRTLPRRARERQQRRTDILQAAESVFAAKGFHAASIEQIARAAEFAAGTVYLYFKDKEALYVELFEQKITELAAIIRDEVEPIKDPVEALKTLVPTRMNYFGRNRAFFQIYAREGMNRYERQHDRWQGVIQLYEKYLTFLTKLIQSGQRRGLVRKGKPRSSEPCARPLPPVVFRWCSTRAWMFSCTAPATRRIASSKPSSARSPIARRAPTVSFRLA